MTKAPTFLVKVVSRALEGDTVFTSLSHTHTNMKSNFAELTNEKSALNSLNLLTLLPTTGCGFC